jgi:hypothetical protein
MADATTDGRPSDIEPTLDNACKIRKEKGFLALDLVEVFNRFAKASARVQKRLFNHAIAVWQKLDENYLTFLRLMDEHSLMENHSGKYIFVCEQEWKLFDSFNDLESWLRLSETGRKLGYQRICIQFIDEYDEYDSSN